MIRVATVSTCIFLSLLGFQGVEAQPTNQGITEAQSEQNENSVFRYLLPILKSDKKAGRLYYTTTCQPNNTDPFPFPQIDVQPPPKGAIGLAAVRGLFLNEENVSVTESQPKVIDITVGKVPETILRTKILALNLAPIVQYNYDVAIIAIENNNQVQAAMHKLGVRTPPVFFDELIALPAPGLPHLPASMMNLTMDQALDAVAITFGGVVLYAACTKPQQYTISFAGGF